MKLAKEKGLSSIAFPSISTGVYGYPKKEACEVAVSTVLKFMDEEGYAPDVIFVQFDDENVMLYKKYIESIKQKS